MKVDDRWVRWLLAPAIVFISQATNDAYLVDYYHHLARGREIVQRGELLDFDIFTYTVPGTPFLDVNWLTQIAYFQLDTWGGLGLVRTVNALLLAGAWLWIVAICRRVSGSLEIAMALGLATFLGSWQVLTIRPQTVSILLFVGLYDVLLRAEKDPRWLAATPLFLTLWANVHGAFPAGLMLIGMFTAGRVFALLPGGALQVGCWIAACVAAAGATLINPYGWEIYVYAQHTSGISAARRIDEWLPPSWDQGIGVAWFVSLPIVIMTLGWSWSIGRRVSWREAFLLLCFGFLAARSIRMVVWWLIIIAPMLSVRLADFWPRSRQVAYPPNRGALFTVIGLAALCVVSLPPLHAFNPILRLRGQDETTANLEKAYQQIAARGEKGNIFTKLEWGEYLGWRGTPNWKVFMDGRIEIIPDEVWEDYKRITTATVMGMFEILNADFLILDKDFHGRTGLYPAIANFGGWEEIGRDGNVVTFVRKKG